MQMLPQLCAIILFMAPMAFADQGVKTDTGKDACLLDINNCSGHYYDIVEKIARLKAAIQIGTRVYSPKELEHIEYLLKESLITADRIDADSSQVPENKDR
ncbi:MAG: hypothetical protein P4L44_14430 [Oryzomonas sp.]|uniref:hypothetical protein n=1 Tax=Oryzomonas sp. TaxID=2855186 RepID=UPI002841644E|nr:hypothetical protein [Oryzomonas sp.]MDR3581154.1 hypothetical protein [Oryzomonas sp.]